MRKILLSLALVLGIISSANASDFAVVAGARMNNGSAGTSGLSISGKTAFQIGVQGFFDINEKLIFRSGFLYAQRYFGYTSSGLTGELNYTYFDIPATLMYQFADYGGIFGGVHLGLKSSASCTVSGGTCTITKDPKSMITPLVFGASFKFAPQMGAEFYYEMTSGDLHENTVKDANAVVLNFLYTFE